MRPSRVDIDNIRQALTIREQRVLLLGVTPELSVLGKRLTAVDNSPRMLANVWPGDSPDRRAILADWTDLPFAEASFDAVIGDAPLNAAPEQVEEVLREVRRVLATRGKVAMRLFCAPEEPETLEAIAADVGHGSNGNFHAMKWRIAMSLAAAKPQASVPVREILEAFNATFPDRDKLAADTGWPAGDISTIDAYVAADHSLGFPTLSTLRRTLERHFSEVSLLPAAGYPLAERCPTVIGSRA